MNKSFIANRDDIKQCIQGLMNKQNKTETK